MFISCVITAIFSLIPCTPAQAQTPLHDFEDISIWSGNPDGGNPPEISADTEFAKSGQGMRIKYISKPPDWGNLLGPCNVPPTAHTLRLWIYKHSSALRASMYIWLREPDGDAWVQEMRFESKNLGSVDTGWYEVELSVNSFNFEPRGKNTREMTTVNEMLIGSNYGDLEVTVDSMVWDTTPIAAPQGLPVTLDMNIETGQRGSIGILQMGAGLPDDHKSAHSPEALAEVLRADGFGVTLLQPGDLLNPDVLYTQNFDALVFPDGPYYPAETTEALIAYFKAGGSFLSTDGYVFDKPCVLTEKGWSTTGYETTAADMGKTGVNAQRLNTRTGQPGDAMNFVPDQVTAFDPSYSMEQITRFTPAGCYAANPVFQALEYKYSEPVEGFSACGLTGLNSPVFPDVYRRWISVLDGRQARDGRDSIRGSALAIMHNYTGNWRGSSWAFSGLTDGTDIFLGDENRKALLCQVMRDITEKVFLHEFFTDLACYQPGETAHLSVNVSNFGKQSASREIILRGAGRELLRQVVNLAPGATEKVSVAVPIDEIKTDYLPITATLFDGGRASDEMDNAICVWDENVIASGPQIGWENNMITVDGAPMFMVGSNQTGMMYYSPTENAWTWNRDFSNMAAHNFHILRILHFSPFSEGGYEGKPTNNPKALVNRPEKFIRQMDAIVQLAQKHRVAIFLSLHDWLPVELTDEELAIQKDWNQFWAARYKNVPGIFYDIQNEPSVGTPANRPDVQAWWNTWLQEKYGNDETLRAAWHRNPPAEMLPDIPIVTGKGEWDDVREADRKRFESEILNRWVKANMEGIKAGDPDALGCVGYLPWMQFADKMLGNHYTDMSNLHFYGEPDGFASTIKMIDRRFDGKGMTLGECGAQEAHDNRTHGSEDNAIAQSIDRFNNYLHYGVGLGASFICNWCWKDFDEMVFPWGQVRLNQQVPKPWIHTWEQGALLVSVASPVYEEPEIYVLAPDKHRMGNPYVGLHDAIKRSYSLLMDQQVNFGVINEEDFDKIPASARAIVWPLPYCPTDETFASVLSWVQAGGTLYLSGDVSFDDNRKPTRSQRLIDLGLPVQEAFSPVDIPAERWQAAPVESAVGLGKVLYVPYPLEMKTQASDTAVYESFVKIAQIEKVAVETESNEVRVMSVPTVNNGHIFSLVRKSHGKDRVVVSIPARSSNNPDGPTEAVTVELAPRGYAFVIVGAEGEVIAVESQGVILIDSREVAKADGHFGVAALDGRDIRTSQQVMVLPHQCSEVSVSGIGAANGYHWFGTPAETDARNNGEVQGGGINLQFTGTQGRIAVLAADTDVESAKAEVAARMILR